MIFSVKAKGAGESGLYSIMVVGYGKG